MAAPGAPAAAAAPPSAPAGTRRGVLFTGIGVAVVGLAAGAVLYGLSGSTKEATVEKFARAPAGCTTTLQFDKSAVFTLYVETKGSVSDPGGDCAANGGTYEHADDDLPRVTLTLVDDADAVQTLTAVSGPRYDVGGYRGQATQQVRIAAAGTYRLTVTSDSTDFAIAIGGKPDADSATMRMGGLGLAGLGVLLGGLLVVLGLRKKAPATVAPATGWPTAPSGVPGAMPQYGAVPGAYTPGASVPGYQPPQPGAPGYPPQAPAMPGVQPPYQPSVPGYQPSPPAEPGWVQQQPAAPAVQHEPQTHQDPPVQQEPSAPPAPPQGPGWGAPS